MDRREAWLLSADGTRAMRLWLVGECGAEGFVADLGGEYFWLSLIHI